MVRATPVRQWIRVVVETCQLRWGSYLSTLEQQGSDLSLLEQQGNVSMAHSCGGCRKGQRAVKHKPEPDPKGLQMIPIEDVSCHDIVSMLDSNVSACAELAELDSVVHRADREQGKCWRPGLAVSALFTMVLATLCSASILTASFENTSTTTTTTTTTMTATTSSATTTTMTTTETTTSSYNVKDIYVNSGRFWVPESPAKANQTPSLFCWALLRVGEQHLVKYQLTNGVGIFDCNEWAVMTDVTVALNRWVSYGFPAIPAWTPNRKDLASWAIGSTQAPIGPEHNALNAFAFMAAWAAIRDSNRIPNHDWVVKVDPDTVWFPQRLRSQLRVKMPSHGNGCDNIFVTNCIRWKTMQGPMEVLSRTAVLKMLAQHSKCGSFNYRAEDQFLVDCLRQLGVNSRLEPTFLNDRYCDGYSNCNDTWKVGFHPFPSVGAFDLCMKQSSR